MSDTPGYQRLFAELKRRKVFRVAAVYGATAFALLQLADVLREGLRLPDSFVPLVTALLLLGFPLALVLAWAYERTPEGLKRTEAAKLGEIEAIAAAPAAKRWPVGLAAAAGTALLLVGGWMALGRPGAVTGTQGDGVASAGAPVPVGGTTLAADAATALDSMPSIAVLPFSNLSNDPDTQPFADGLQDDLLTQLYRIGSMRVISRTSVQEYRNTTKGVPEIARELGVRTVLEGGVQRAGNQFRLNVQLIDAWTDGHVWADQYQGELTTANIFAVQSEIAEAIAGALQAELSPDSVRSLAQVPTESLEAWEAYNRGRLLAERPGDEKIERRTIEEFRRAVEIDPEFLAAWAGLLRAQTWLIRRALESDPAPARASLERLEALAPDAFETRLAKGYFRYYALADFAGALPEFEAALAMRPGDPEAEAFVGYVQRRLGRWKESTVHILRASASSPRDANQAWDLGMNYEVRRMFDRARDAYDRSLELDPTGLLSRLHKEEFELFRLGDVAAAEATAAGAPEGTAPDIRALENYWPAIARRDFTAAEAAVRGVRAGALRVGAGIGGEMKMPADALTGLAHFFAGNREAARASGDSLVAVAEGLVRERPVPPGGKDVFGFAAMPRADLALGLALRGRPGDERRALQLADEAVRLNGLDVDAVDGTGVEWMRLYVQLLVGRRDDALAGIERLLDRPSLLGVGELRWSPIFDSLRGDPRFEALVKKAADMSTGEYGE